MFDDERAQEHHEQQQREQAAVEEEESIRLGLTWLAGRLAHYRGRLVLAGFSGDEAFDLVRDYQVELLAYQFGSKDPDQ